MNPRRSCLSFSLPLLLVTGCGPHAASTPRTSAEETISIRASEGTHLAFDLSPDGRSIAFDLLGQLWLIPAEGGEARPLTDAVRDTAVDLDPSFSPDGGRLLFRGERGGRTGLWLLDLAAPGPRQLTQLADPSGHEGGAAWSPDGRTVAFARAVRSPAAGGQWLTEVALLDAATGAVSSLPIESLGDSGVHDPAWTEDGERIVFVAGSGQDDRGGPLAIVNASGGKAALLTADTVRAFAPEVAPDKRRVAFLAADSAGRTQVWVQDIQRPGLPARPPARLTNHADVARTRVRWTPDGAALVYSADGLLWRVAAAGGRPSGIPFTINLSITRPVRALPSVRFPAPGVEQVARGFMDLELSPDARHIAILALGRLWIMVPGGPARAIAEVPHDARHLAWSADAAELAWSAGSLGAEDLFATDVAGGRTRRITTLPGREVHPAYSPDGKHLAFVYSPAEDTAHLYLVDAQTRSISDASRMRPLGAFDLGWTASDALVPQWSPASDAMLDAVGGFNEGEVTHGEIIGLSGARRVVQRFPDAPIYLQWVAGSILFVRHDRLWRADFDSSGMLAQPRVLGDAPALYASAARDGTVLYLSEGGLRLRRPDGTEQRIGWPLTFTPPVPDPLLIRNVRLIAGTGTPTSRGQDLVLERGRITQIAPAGTVPAATRDVIDAEGRIAIPGLMDLHAHTYQPDLLPGFVYFGITTIRDQGSPMAPLVAQAEAIAAGLMEGPRVGYGGFQFYSDWAFDTDDGRGVEPEADPGHLARAVALAAIFGSQHIKTRTFRRWDINARMVAEAHRRGMRATGHCAHQLPLVAAGIDAKEHIGMCEARGDAVLYDDLIQLFRASGIGVVPTISYWGFAARLGERPGLLDDDTELKAFLPPPSSFGWMVNATADQRRERAREAEGARSATARLARAGVTIGTGTDIWQVPPAVHMELAELVAAGLSPLEAIGAATAGSARILGAEAELGTIEVGKYADLVILDADPLSDIRNTRRIWRVIKGGRLVDRKAIAEGRLR